MPEKSWEFVSIERKNRVALVQFDRGDRINALSNDLMVELTEAAQILETDLSIQSIVLTGNVHTFSAGADLSDPKTRDRGKATLLEQRQMLRVGPDLCDAWERLEQTTIAAIEGFAIGGGVALAVACDFRFVAEDAHLRLPEVPLGMNMSWHSLPRLVALVGPARAKQFTILGERLEANEALAWRMIEKVTAKGGTKEAALEMARKVAALPPIPVRMSKQAINVAAMPVSQSSIYMDRDQFLLTSQTNDQREAVSAFFEKREPDFKGD